jgi:hypothetical protein
MDYPWRIGGNEIACFFTFGNNSKPGWYSAWISGEQLSKAQG